MSLDTRTGLYVLARIYIITGKLLILCGKLLILGWINEYFFGFRLFQPR